MKLDSLMLIVGAAGLVYLTPRVADACHNVTVCVKYRTYTEDMGAGDFPEHTDEGVTSFPARGVRVTVIPPPPEPPRQEIITDPDGCFTLETQFADGTKLLVHPEAFLGTHPDEDEGVYNIRVAAFPSCDEVLEEQDDGEGGILYDASPVHLHHLVADAVAKPTVDAYTPEQRLFALTIWIIAKLEDELDLQGSLRLALWTEDSDLWSTDCKETWNGGVGGFANTTELFLTSSVALKKFAIGHEIGHWLFRNWTGTAGINYYGYPVIDNNCKFKAADENINSYHGLRSAEFGTAAMTEGWGHFVSAYVFDDDGNPDARFKYYKEIDNEEYEGNYTDLIVDDNYNVSLLGEEVCDNEQPPVCHVLGGDLAWVESKCQNDWQSVFEQGYYDVSSEIDWMRFFWQLSSAEAATGHLPEVALEEILDALDATNVGTPTYLQLEAVWPAGSLARFQALEDLNEVYNGN